MQFGKRWARLALTLVPVALLAVAVACGSSSDKTSTSATSAATPAATRVATVAATAAGAGGGAATASTMTVTMTDNKFEPAALTVKANQQITINLDNKGSAIHNLHVLNVKGTDGKDITSSLLAADKQEALKFTIDKPGTYDIQCDVHPAEMKGKLTVQ